MSSKKDWILIVKTGHPLIALAKSTHTQLSVKGTLPLKDATFYSAFTAQIATRKLPKASTCQLRIIWYEGH